MAAAAPETFIQAIDPADNSLPWVVIGASVQGASHARLALPCQDAHAYKAINAHTLVAAVADGLGTAANSQSGSKLAAASAVTCVEQVLANLTPSDEDAWIKLVREAFSVARARLVQEAQGDPAALREYGTTLILAVLTDTWLVTGQIGDGAVVAALDDGQLVLFSSPQNDEYANVTYPLTMPEMDKHAIYKASLQKVKALAILSDGMQHVSIRSADNSPHPPFFEPLFRQLPGVKDMPKASQNLAEYMASPAISSRSDDDKTLLLIGRRRS